MRAKTVEISLTGLDAILKKVAKQADDDGLWFIAQTASEEYLQFELRTLHYLIETVLGKENKFEKKEPTK